MGVRAVVFLAVLAVAVSTIAAMDKSKFHTFEQEAFGPRQRSLRPGQLVYTVDSSSVRRRSDDGALEAIVALRAEPKELVAGRPEVVEAHVDPLVLNVFAYGRGIYRIRVTEQKPHNNVPRYEVLDVVLPDRKPVADTTLTRAGATFTFAAVGDDATVTLSLQPFRLSLVDKSGAVVVEVNGADLFNFETGRSNLNVHDSNPDHYDQTHQSVGADVSFPGAKHVVGIPERAVAMSLPATRGADAHYAEPYRMYNLDIFEYELDNSVGLYGAIPLLIGIRTKGAVSGALWLNAAQTFVDIEKSDSKILSHWMSESGIVNLFLFAGPTPAKLYEQYALITGTTPLPQLFSLGYHQCRWNYKDEADVAQVDNGFDEHNIPYDVIWLDIEHTDGKRYFSWDKALFPHPEQMQAKLAAKGRKLVTISDPHIKRDSSWSLFREAEERGYFSKKADGTGDYDGWCWPGSSSWLDFFNPEVRDWYATKFSLESYVGSTPILHTWIDMNEPSVFTGPEVTMDREKVVHKLSDGSTALHRDVHNQYGYYQGMAVYKGLKDRQDGNDRPFILSRSFFAGSQRYVSVWTGDNSAEWSHLRISTPMLLALNSAGLPFVGADVGGFFKNPEPELLTRWYQTGAFTPFFRGHAHIDTRRREPWLFGEENTNLIRQAIHTRYTLLPLWYTLFRESEETGMPVMRALWMEFGDDESILGADNVFLVGDSLLVAPVTEERKRSVEVYLPRKSSEKPGRFYEYFSGALAGNGGSKIDAAAPADRIPVFAIGGHIIPRKDRLRRSSTQQALDPYTLVVALDENGEASGRLYVDDGHSFDYRSGAFVDISLRFAGVKLTGTVTNNPSNGFTISNRIEKVLVYGWNRTVPTRAVVVQDGAESSVDVLSNSSTGVLVVRKPWCMVASDFSITLE